MKRSIFNAVKVALASMTCAVVVTAHAGDMVPLVEQRGIPQGPGKFFPSVDLQVGFDDNVTQVENNEIDSGFAVLNPQVEYRIEKGPNVDSAMAGVSIGSYFDSSEDNYEDAQLAFRTRRQLSPLMLGGLQAQYQLGHDPRGATDRGIGLEPDTWHLGSLRGMLAYGDKSAQASGEVEAGITTKRYKDFSLPEKIEDKDIVDIGANLYYRLQPKTHALFGVDYAMTDFDSELSVRDSNQYRLWTGLVWKATQKTTGKVRVGFAKRDYDEEAIDDFTGANWEGAVQWSPTAQALIDVATSRKAEDTSGGAGDYILTDNFYAGWTHKWIPRVASKASVSYSNRDYENHPASRSDDEVRVALTVNYKIPLANRREWLSIGAGIASSQRDSNINTEDYDRNIFSLTFSAVF